MGYCGHKGYIISCSKTVFVGDSSGNCKGIARCGDSVGKDCIVGKIVTCSENVLLVIDLI